MPLRDRLLPTRRRAPASVQAVELERGERRLSWAVTSDGQAVVAATMGLYLPGRSRLDWPDVERISWRRPLLLVLEVAEIEGQGDRASVELQDEGDLPDAVRTQVTASVGWSRHHRIAGGGVRVVGRRRAGQELLQWQLVYDHGTDPRDPAVRQQAEDLLLGARRTIG